MARKAILSKCDRCKQPKPGYEYRRFADKTRHGSCIVCEDTLAAIKAQAVSAAQAKKRAYNKARYECIKGTPANCHKKRPASAPPNVQTRWVGGKYPCAM